MKFEIHTSNNEQICLRKYLIKYRDFEKNHHHTLNNILLFNNIDINVNSLLKINRFSSGEKKEYVLLYDDINHHHITFFYELE